MSEVESDRGSGFTAYSVVKKMRERLEQEYLAQLKSLGGTRFGFKKKQIEDMASGHGDGMTNMLRILVDMGIVVVVDDEPG